MDSTRLSRFCEAIIQAGWLAAVVATPLFFNIHSARVFEPDKLTLLRSVTLVMIAAWLVRFVDQQGWRDLSWLKPGSENAVWRLPLVLPVSLIVLVYVLSSIFSVTPVVSWVGSYQRLQGTYTTLSYIVIFALMLATTRRREQVATVVTMVIITSIPVSLYAMLQHYGLDPLPWGGDVQRRVAGHMGNSIFIAAYLIMAVPLTLARIIDAFTNILNDKELALADTVRSSIYVFALAIQLIAIVWSQSRGPFLGLAIGLYAFVLILLVTLRNSGAEKGRFGGQDAARALAIVLAGTAAPFLAATTLLRSAAPITSLAVFLGSVALLVLVILVLAVARRGWRWLWLSWILVAVLMAGFLGLFNLSGRAEEGPAQGRLSWGVGETLASWRELPEIGRFGRLLESERGSGRVRVLIWEGVLELIAPHEPLATPFGERDPYNLLRPIVGYGPESMYVAYNRFYVPELATIEARNASPDRAHNETFDALVITGVAGLLAWQSLYLSFFYYAFKWLGVMRSRRDRRMLIGLWVAGAAAVGGAITAWQGLPFLGVALPFGAIAGLVLYLIYYAFFTREPGEERVDPFSPDRLLMIAIVGAVLAHYVEIHFGIAIAATRAHFFVYLALLVLVGHRLPHLKKQAQEAARVGRRTRSSRVVGPGAQGWLSPTLTAAVLLGLMLVILVYNFTTFSLPQGEEISVMADVPSPGDIFRQAFLVNANSGHAPSPFVYLMFVLSWLLGVLVLVAELAKRGVLKLGTSGPLNTRRGRSAAALLLGLALLSVIHRFLLGDQAAVNMNRMVGNGLLTLWIALTLWVAIRLILQRPSARLTAGALATAGLALSLPILAAGATTQAILLAVASVIVLYLLWDPAWKDILVPAAAMAVLSVAIGLAYAYIHAVMVRSNMLPPLGVTATTPELARRVMEADQAAAILTTFYVIVAVLLVAAGFSLTRPANARHKGWGTPAGYAVALLLVLVTPYLAGATNLRIIQADMVYKRADPWDKQASQTRDPALWDNAIAIYEHAINYAPDEDFYYLWLGRAYLERAALSEDPAEQEALLSTAERRLAQAQRLNPLNTDHTANLARLHTRWAESSAGADRTRLTDRAEQYYVSAVALSPQNSVIINEYARLALLLQDDCDKATDLFDLSLERDPYYANTYFERGEVYMACASRHTGEGAREYLREAAASVAAGLERQPNQPRRWLLLADLFIRLGDDEQVTIAYDEVIARGGEELPEWRVAFTIAQWYQREGDLAMAGQFARRSLAMAPTEVAAQIEEFVNELSATGSSGG
jgi:hypothetical protein